MRWTEIAAVGVTVCLAGCSAGAGQVAEKLRPTSFTAADALEEHASAGQRTSDAVRVLVVDWPQDERGELEAQMAHGIALVAYDGKAVRLLHDCQLDGEYGYVGVTRKEEVTRLNTADELGATLPKIGALLGTDVGAEMKRGATLDLAIVMVGSRTTTRRRASRANLASGCTGATHFVRGASVGAFALSVGSQAQARTAAEVFGGGARGSALSERTMRRADGQIEACNAAGLADKAPPSQCGALYRIVLAPLDDQDDGAPGGVDEAEPDADACPSGTVFAGGKCAAPSAGVAHACAPGDAGDCETQCGRGSAASCHTLALMLERGRGVPADDPRAARLYKQACDGGVAAGCSGLGFMVAKGRGVPQDDAAATRLFRKACDAGDARGCTNLGFMYVRGRGGLAQDLARGVQLYARGCDGGDANGCRNLGVMHDRGASVPADAARAAELFRRACDGGVMPACAYLGSAYAEGKGVPRDDARAKDLLQRACSARVPDACEALAKVGQGAAGATKAVPGAAPVGDAGAGTAPAPSVPPPSPP